MQPRKTDLLNEYLATVDSIYGAYLDAITGFSTLVEEYATTKRQMIASRPAIPPEEFDSAQFIYGTGHPRRPASRVIHTCTQGEYRRRNDKGGRNHVVMGQLCLVQIYGYWEDWYREQIARCCAKKKNKLVLDVMGDLRWLRISIIHHGGIALKDVNKCKRLRWFREGDAMGLTPEHFEELVSTLRSDLTAYLAAI